MKKDKVIGNAISKTKFTRSFVKHKKSIHVHIQKHQKKYFFGSAIYRVSHILVVKVLALKFLFIKLVVGLLAVIGIANPSLKDIFAKMDNICINNTPIIAQEVCQKNFDSVQDAVNYIESMIDPEIDTIYTAQYYGIIPAIVEAHCSGHIDKSIVAEQKKKLDVSTSIRDPIEKIRVLKEAHTLWKIKSMEYNLAEEAEFCNQKYLAYTMLDTSKALFLKQLRSMKLLNPQAMVFGKKLVKKSDNFILDNFIQRREDVKWLGIHYTLQDLWDITNNEIANIIKNISVKAADDSIQALRTLHLIGEQEQQTIKEKLAIGFVLSCGKNTWYHRINQYYTDNDVLQKTTLEEIQINIGLCNSFQYIDQLEEQVKKLVTHELWHYIYYLKDTTSKQFSKICRDKKEKGEENICDNDGFVSRYAQTSSEEDYADTFSRWTITQMDPDQKYLSLYRKDHLPSSWSSLEWNGIVFIQKTHSSAGHEVAERSNGVSMKFEYFDALLAKVNVRL